MFEHFCKFKAIILDDFNSVTYVIRDRVSVDLAQLGMKVMGKVVLIKECATSITEVVVF